MDELYTESFFQQKKSPPPKAVEAAVHNPVPPVPKIQQQLQSSIWLLQQEVNKRFPNSFPVQKLCQQIEEGFAATDHAHALRALEKLEEWIDAQMGSS